MVYEFILSQNPVLHKKFLQCAVTDASVLLYGEGGLGKSELARFIHNHSRRSRYPFVQINGSQIPTELFSSELFGHAPHAFTGASNKGKTGLIEKAHRGTLLFQNINELSAENQTLLLHFLQNKTIMPIGSLQSRPIDTRIICTSNENLKQLTNAGKFRLDLYYRISVINLRIPSLREQSEIIPELLSYYIDKYAEESKLDKNRFHISSKDMNLLKQLEWKGNLFELINLAQQIVYSDHIEDVIYNKTCQLDSGKPISSKESISRMPIQKQTLKEAVREFEAQYIIDALKRNKSPYDAARELGISYSTLCRKKQELNLFIKSSGSSLKK